MIQFISEEVTEGKLINPTARVYIEKGLWDSDFEIKFRKKLRERRRRRRTGSERERKETRQRGTRIQH